jgi:hypothetical protein
MMLVLFDDERNFKSELLAGDTEVLILRTAQEALDWLSTTTPETVVDQMWWDHDLGKVNGVKETVIPALRKLEEMCFFGTAPHLRQVVVHTTNPTGGAEIVTALSRYFPLHRVVARDYLVGPETREEE